MKPKVTVLMAVYNGEAYLQECVKSVLDQTCKDYEFLIIDDGSIDKTVDIIRSFGDDRIRLLQNSRNLSQVASLNIGLDHARGEYIARIDADDAMVPNRLEMQTDFLDRNPQIALAGSRGDTVDENGRPTAFAKVPVKTEEIIVALLFGGCFISIHSSFMFRKEIILKVGKYNEAFSFTEDYKLITDLLLGRYGVANMPERLVKYRIHANRISVRDSKPQMERYVTAARQFLKRLTSDFSNEEFELLFNFLASAGLLRNQYWTEVKNTDVDLKTVIRLLNLLLTNITSYFEFNNHSVFLIKRVFYRNLLNFAYRGVQLKSPEAWGLYSYCSKNWPYMLERPKLYLSPLTYALSVVKHV